MTGAKKKTENAWLYYFSAAIVQHAGRRIFQNETFFIVQPRVIL